MVFAAVFALLNGVTHVEIYWYFEAMDKNEDKRIKFISFDMSGKNPLIH